MRRTALTIVATVVGLALLLQFKTHPATTGGAFASLATPPPAQHRAHHRQHAPPAISPTPTAQRTSARPLRHTAPPSPRTVSSTGQTIATPYGPVQVRIVETGGRLQDVVALQLPGGSPRSTEIAAGATPILREEALRANSARIRMVSGATYTSEGYAQSLQSAIDNA